MPVAVSVSGSAFGAEASATVNIFNGSGFGGGGGTSDVIPNWSGKFIFTPYKNLIDNRYSDFNSREAGRKVGNILSGASVSANHQIGPVQVGVEHSFAPYKSGTPYGGVNTYSIGGSMGVKSIKSPFKSSIGVNNSFPLWDPIWNK